ncbi:MAG: hypothetical protein ACLQOO_00215 [Terriglobia bacterium]
MPDILRTITESLRKADRAMDEGFSRKNEIDPDDEEMIRYYLDGAFLQSLFLLESLNAPRMLSNLQQTYRRAKKDYSKIDLYEGEPFLAWSSKLQQYLSAIEATLGEPGSRAVSKDVIEILRNCQYAITDPYCFGEPPANEPDVHRRIEAVLRCVFPDLEHEPPIAKPIKNFKPDTGLRLIRTLIEYKFIEDENDAKRVAGEVLADTRGYVSQDWDTFLYVIYETHRIKTEHQWNQLMRKSGLGDNTKVIVIAGEPPSPERAVKLGRRNSGRGRKPNHSTRADATGLN